MQLIIIWLGLFLLSFPCIAQPFIIVTNATNLLTPLTDSQAKMLYHGRLTHIDGHNVLLADLPANSAFRDHFYRTLLGKSPTQMQVIRARQIFSGQLIPPYELKDNTIEAVEQWLTKHPNGIAYIPLQWKSDSVHILYQFGDGESL